MICQIRRSVRSKILCLCRFYIGEEKTSKIERCKIWAIWWLIAYISHFIFKPLMLLINNCPRSKFCSTLDIFLLAYTIQWRPSDFHCYKRIWLNFQAFVVHIRYQNGQNYFFFNWNFHNMVFKVSVRLYEKF